MAVRAVRFRQMFDFGYFVEDLADLAAKASKKNRESARATINTQHVHKNLLLLQVKVNDALKMQNLAARWR